MREIKFRVWDRKEKNFIFFNENSYEHFKEESKIRGVQICLEIIYCLPYYIAILLFFN